MMGAAQVAAPAAAIAQARSLLDAGKPGEAIAILQPLVAGLPKDSTERRDAAQVLGLSHYLAGHIAESIPYLEEVRASAPGDMKLAYALAMAYAQTRQADKARDSIARTFQ